jgi:3-dehydroquinate synthase
MITVTVELEERAYPILIGSRLLEEPSLLQQIITTRQVMLVTNDIVAPLYLARMTAALEQRDCRTVVLPDGEAFKNLASFERILTALLEARFDRGATIVALGGGVVGDIAGFAAACYQRGVNFVQAPTTLLAQVDSSVGGKTAVNHPLGKNMIGAFYQPTAVIADLDTLRTLPRRELCAGIAEIIKYGLIGDAAFVVWLETHMQQLLMLDFDAISYAVEYSCRAKAAVVAADERESGLRALLNFGHTFGHGIEHAMGYGAWLHGEAVGAGMAMAARMSQRLGRITRTECERVVALIASAGLPTYPPADVSVNDLHAAMMIDKKNREGRIRLVLLSAVGKANLCDDYPTPLLLTTLAERAGSDG